MSQAGYGSFSPVTVVEMKAQGITGGYRCRAADYRAVACSLVGRRVSKVAYPCTCSVLEEFPTSLIGFGRKGAVVEIVFFFVPRVL